MKAKDWDRLAKEYHELVVSPFQKGVKNPLFRKLDELNSPKTKIIADIGCGRGDILNTLASKFKRVYAVDFSPTMIKIAKKRSSKENINFFVKDMRYLQMFKNKFDVVIAVNSIIMPKIQDVRRALKSIYSTLKKGGLFYGIFPSMEAILYQGFLILEDQIEKHKDERKALRKTRRILERRKYNFINGTFNDNGEVQKFYYDFELKMRLKDIGFKNVTMSRVLYPWREDISDFVDFPGRPMMWDWFVSAGK